MFFLLSIFVVRFGSTQQTTGVTPAQFNAALRAVATNEAQWHKLIDSVNIEGLPISYAEGKQLDQNKTIVRQDLDMVVLWAVATAKDKNSLYDEVNFMSATQELQNQLQAFVDLLLADAPNDNVSAKKVTGWTESLAALANGPINDIWKTSFLYVTNHAKQLDKACGRG
jgi:hypothetical protein